MGFSHHYTHTCTIVSYTVGQSARGAQTKTASGTQTLVKCRFVHPKQPDSEPLPELGQMIRTDAYLFLNPSISVDTEAEISNVRWKSDGALVDADAAVLPRRAEAKVAPEDGGPHANLLPRDRP